MADIQRLKKVLGRQDVQLFIVLMLIFTVFLGWGGSNSWSRYDLTASMVENRSLNIESFSENTVDKLTPREQFTERNLSRNASPMIFDQTDTVYTDKAPLSSIAAIPGYMMGEMITGGENGQNSWIRNGIGSLPVYLSFETSLKMLMIVLTVSAVSGALLITLIYRYLRDELGEKTAFYTAIILGIATPIFTYATSFFGVAGAAMFGFTSFLALRKSLSEEDRRWMIVAGLLSAAAVSFEYYAGLIPLGLLTYLYLESGKDDSLRFAAGAFIGSLPLMLYHWLITGNPLLPAPFARDLITIGPMGEVCSLFPGCYLDYYGFMLDPVRAFNAATRLLFFPTRGLFFYAPILLLTIPGIYEIYRKDRRKLILFPGIFLLFLLLQSTRLNWLAGVSFGPRYLIVALPFLSLPLAYGVKKFSSKGKAWRALIFVVFLVSVFNIMLGFGSWGSISMDKDTYSERFNSLSAVQPEFYSDRVDSFMEYGPRSEVLMSLTDRYKQLDLTHQNPYGPEHFELFSAFGNGLLFSTQLIPLILFAGLLTGLAWRRDSKRLQLTGLVLIAAMILLSFNVASTYILGDYYRSSDVPDAVNGSMNLVTHEEDSITYLQLFKNSPREEIKIDLDVNGEKQASRTIKEKSGFPLTLTKEGRNEIEINTDGCTVPGKVINGSLDYRCVSFTLDSVSSNSTEDFNEPVLNGFYGKNIDDKPWMSEKGRITFTGTEEEFIPVLTLEKLPFLDEYDLSFSMNGKHVKSIESMAGESRKYYIANATSNKGVNSLSVEAAGCKVPAEQVESSRDERCLSYRLNNFSLQKTGSAPLFDEGWYEKTEEEGRWMGESGRFFRYLDQNRTYLMTLELRGYNMIGNNTAQVYLNGRSIRNFSMDSTPRKMMLPVRGRRGYNELEIRSARGCKVPQVVEESSRDDRCLSMYLMDFNMSDIDERTYREGWFSEEEAGPLTYRWISDEAHMIFNGHGGDIMTITAERYSKLGNSSMKLYLDGEEVAELEGDIDRRFVYLNSNKGPTSLRMQSTAGCTVPAQVEENSQDERCLSYRVEEIEIDDRSYGDGWFDREEVDGFTYRWMDEESLTNFTSDDETVRMKFEFKPYEYLDTKALQVFVNGQSQGILNLDGQGRVTETIEMDAERGINQLRLKSLGGCRKPKNSEEGSMDVRCLSFQFSGFEVRD